MWNRIEFEITDKAKRTVAAHLFLYLHPNNNLSTPRRVSSLSAHSHAAFVPDFRLFKFTSLSSKLAL